MSELPSDPEMHQKTPNVVIRVIDTLAAMGF